jgi:hypothetical protein
MLGETVGQQLTPPVRSIQLSGVELRFLGYQKAHGFSDFIEPVLPKLLADAF